ncbi:MAG: hypothetical protein ACJ77A_13735 [Actinomycetota bacterium]
MTHYDPPHTHEPYEAPPNQGSGLTGYAIAKYGFILLIVIAILWFLAQVVIPAFTS